MSFEDICSDQISSFLHPYQRLQMCLIRNFLENIYIQGSCEQYLKNRNQNGCKNTSLIWSKQPALSKLDISS